MALDGLLRDEVLDKIENFAEEKYINREQKCSHLLGDII
jgi:hypothetical protein